MVCVLIKKKVLSEMVEKTLKQEEETSYPNGEDDENIEKSRESFNSKVREAKDLEAQNALVKSLKTYRHSLDIFPSFADKSKKEKLQRKIEKLEELISKWQDMNNGFIKDHNNLFVADSSFVLSEKLYNTLFKYQREGVIWLWNLHRRVQGGILGDDMGLGKTIQIVALLSGLFRNRYVSLSSGKCQPHIHSALIVVPVSLMINWKNEINKWTPETIVKSFYGSKSERERNLKSIQSCGGVCLTTYGTVLSNIDLLNDSNRHKWDYVILDEGHKIKNPSRKITKALAAVQSRHRLILTGTPIQNNLLELWSMFDFVCCGKLLGERSQFKTEYQKQIEQGNEKDALEIEKEIGSEMAKSLRQLIEPHFLRREKGKVMAGADVQPEEDQSEQKRDVGGDPNPPNNGEDLPQIKARKNEFNVWCLLTDYQIELYTKYGESDEIKALLNTSRSPLAALTVLKKICDHPSFTEQQHDLL